MKIKNIKIKLWRSREAAEAVWKKQISINTHFKFYIQYISHTFQIFILL
jgi:hypothetical protein